MTPMLSITLVTIRPTIFKNFVFCPHSVFMHFIRLPY